MEEQSRSDVSVEEEKSKFVIFSLHDDLYAFEGADVKEILPALEVFPVPGAPQAVPGVINNRGDIESVINLHVFLGLHPSEHTACSRIVMTAKSGVRSGMLVDSVIDVVDLPPSSVKPPLSTLDDATRKLVTGEMTYQGRSVVLLDVCRIIEALRTHER